MPLESTLPNEAVRSIDAARQSGSLLSKPIVRLTYNPEHLVPPLPGPENKKDQDTIERLTLYAYRSIRAVHSAADFLRATSTHGFTYDADGLLRRLLTTADSTISADVEFDAWLIASESEPGLFKEIINAVWPWRPHMHHRRARSEVVKHLLTHPECIDTFLNHASRLQEYLEIEDYRNIFTVHALEMMLTADRPRRALAAWALRADDRAHRSMAAARLASEENLRIAVDLARLLRDYPGEAATSLASSPIAHALTYELYTEHNWPSLTLPYPLSEISASSRQACVKFTLFDRLFDRLYHIGGLHVSEFRDGIVDAFREAAYEERRVAADSKPLPISHALTAALVAASGLNFRTMPQVEVVHAPRWSYLSTVIPRERLVAELRGQGRLDGLIKLEDSFQRNRDELARVRQGLIERLTSERPDRSSGPEVSPRPDERSGRSGRSGERSSEDRTSLTDALRAFPELTAAQCAEASRDRGFQAVWSDHTRLLAELESYTRTDDDDQTRRWASLLQTDLDVDIDHALGTYHPVDHRITLYPWMIEVVARKLGVHKGTLHSLTLIHEACHAILIRGVDELGQAWGTYDQISEDLHEMITCLLTETTAWKLSALGEWDLSKRLTDDIFPGLAAVRDGVPDLQPLIRILRNLELWAPEHSEMLQRALQPLRVSAQGENLRVEDASPEQVVLLVALFLREVCDGPTPAPDVALRLNPSTARRAMQKRWDPIFTPKLLFPRLHRMLAFFQLERREEPEARLRSATHDDFEDGDEG